MYAFGVVLFEIISANGPIMKRNEALTQPTALVALVLILALHYYNKRICEIISSGAKFVTCFLVNLFQFEDALSQSDPGEDLRKLVDPRLGDNYSLDSILKVMFFMSGFREFGAIVQC